MEMSHRIPHVPIVDRVELLSTLAASHDVIHCGFVGQEEGRWQLHERLSGVAKSLTGIDIDPDGVSEAKTRGYEAYAADCRDPEQMRALNLNADLVIAGELIEHLDAPGSFLTAMHHLATRLVITTPNAFSLMNTLGAVVGREFVNPTHVVAFSYSTLSRLLENHGWQPGRWWVYRYPPQTLRGKIVFGIETAASRLFSFLGHGLIVESEEAPPAETGGAER